MHSQLDRSGASNLTSSVQMLKIMMMKSTLSISSSFFVFFENSSFVIAMYIQGMCDVMFKIITLTFYEYTVVAKITIVTFWFAIFNTKSSSTRNFASFKEYAFRSASTSSISCSRITTMVSRSFTCYFLTGSKHRSTVTLTMTMSLVFSPRLLAPSALYIGLNYCIAMPWLATCCGTRNAAGWWLSTLSGRYHRSSNAHALGSTSNQRSTGKDHKTDDDEFAREVRSARGSLSECVKRWKVLHAVSSLRLTLWRRQTVKMRFSFQARLAGCARRLYWSQFNPSKGWARNDRYRYTPLRQVLSGRSETGSPKSDNPRIRPVWSTCWQ